MRVASHRTIENNKRTRFAYAYNALERDSMLCLDNAAEIDADFTSLLNGTLSKEDQIEWAFRERDWKLLNEDE